MAITLQKSFRNQQLFEGLSLISQGPTSTRDAPSRPPSVSDCQSAPPRWGSAILKYSLEIKEISTFLLFLGLSRLGIGNSNSLILRSARPDFHGNVVRNGFLTTSLFKWHVSPLLSSYLARIGHFVKPLHFGFGGIIIMDISLHEILITL